MPSTADFNKTINLVTNTTSDYSLKNTNDKFILVDSSNNRLGINTENPEYSIDVCNDIIKTSNLYFDLSLALGNNDLVSKTNKIIDKLNDMPYGVNMLKINEYYLEIYIYVKNAGSDGVNVEKIDVIKNNNIINSYPSNGSSSSIIGLIYNNTSITYILPNTISLFYDKFDISINFSSTNTESEVDISFSLLDLSNLDINYSESNNKYIIKEFINQSGNNNIIFNIS